MKTAKVLARFGPRLPALMEQALIAQSQEPASDHSKRSWKRATLFGALAGALATFLLVQIF